MLIKPDFKDEEIIACLRDAYGLTIEKVVFLPLGADFNTAVYRVTTTNQTDYFLKLRGGEFLEALYRFIVNEPRKRWDDDPEYTA